MANRKTTKLTSPNASPVTGKTSGESAKLSLWGCTPLTGISRAGLPFPSEGEGDYRLFPGTKPAFEGLPQLSALLPRRVSFSHGHYIYSDFCWTPLCGGPFCSYFLCSSSRESLLSQDQSCVPRCKWSCVEKVRVPELQGLGDLVHVPTRRGGSSVLPGQLLAFTLYSTK